MPHHQARNRDFTRAKEKILAACVDSVLQTDDVEVVAARIHETLFEVFLPVPPLLEQHQIVEVLDIDRQKLDASRASTESTIAILKERRSAQ